MPLTVSVLGGTGVYARHLLPRLTARGHRVRAMARRPETAVTAQACGAEVHRADIFDRDSMIAALRGSDVSINLATSLSARGGPADYAMNDRIRQEGVPVWLEACAEAGVARVLQQSIAWVNATGTDEWGDEDTFVPEDGDGASARATGAARRMEEIVRASSLDWVILRGGLFYGPGTGFDDGWFERASAGRLRLPGDGSAFVSLVHIADMANATVAAVERWPSRRAVNVVDDAPVRWAELFGYVAACVGAPAPAPGGMLGFPSSRLRNGLAKELLGWSPLYPDYRSGLAR